MKKVAYISGPMRGIPGLNWQAFAEAQSKLEALGYDVINPAAMDAKIGFTPDNLWHLVEKRQALRDLKGVLDSDIVVMLPNWHRSMGARAEVAVARWVGRKVIPLSRIKKSL